MISQKPDFALSYYWKGNCQSQIEVLDSSKMGLARPTYQYFIELASPTPDKFKTQLITAYDYLGYFYAVNQDNPEFKDSWAALARDAVRKKILVIDPSNKGAQENLKKIPGSQEVELNYNKKRGCQSTAFFLFNNCYYLLLSGNGGIGFFFTGFFSNSLRISSIPLLSC